MKLFWKQYIISCLIVAFGVGFMQIVFFQKPDWATFIMWLPISWFLILAFALMINLFLNWGDKE